MPPFDIENPQLMTPGSAVADQLQNILARKRADARQQMLDQLNVMSTQKQWEDRDEQLASLREQREAVAEQRKQNAARIQAEMDSKARNREMWAQAFPILAQNATPEQAAFLQAVDPESDLAKVLMQRMIPQEKEKPDLVTPQLYDPNTRKWISAPDGVQVPRTSGDAIGTIPWAPREPQGPQPTVEPWRGTNGHTIMVSNRPGPNGLPSMVDSVTGKPYTGPISRIPTGAEAEFKWPVLPQESAAYAAALKKATAKPGMFFGSTTPDAGDVANAQQLKANMISRFPSSFGNILAQTADNDTKFPDAATKITNKMIVDQAVASGDVPPEHADAFARFLTMFR